jgi:hypothetical protein
MRDTLIEAGREVASDSYKRRELQRDIRAGK